jgi:hypothetical protein
MQPNTYPDGFPINPAEAINFSYFLSKEEKDEWLNWLQSSTVEQQHELVDTLHSMWIENQKEVVPAGFNLSSNQNTNTNLTPIPEIVSPEVNTFKDQTKVFEEKNAAVLNEAVKENVIPQIIAPTFQPAPQIQPAPVAVAPVVATNPAPVLNSVDITEPVPLTIPETPAQEKQPENIAAEIPAVQEKPIPVPEVPLIVQNVDNTNQTKPVNQNNQMNQSNQKQRNNSNQQNVKNDDNESLKQFGQNKYTPNPVLDDKTNNSADFVFQNGNPKGKNNRRSNDNDDSNENLNQANNQPVETKKAFFNFSKLREVATRKSLEDVYQQYVQSKDKSFTSEQEFRDNHAIFLDKIMKIVVNFESVSDFFEAITAKLLEMNDQNVVLAEKFSRSQEENRSVVRDLTRQVDDLRRDLDRSYRDQKRLEEDLGRVNIKSNQSDVDVFGGDALQQKVELLLARITKLEQSSPDSSIRERLSSLQKNLPEVKNEKVEVEEKPNTPSGSDQNSNKRRIDIKNLF